MCVESEPKISFFYNSINVNVINLNIFVCLEQQIIGFLKMFLFMSLQLSLNIIHQFRRIDCSSLFQIG